MTDSPFSSPPPEWEPIKQFVAAKPDSLPTAQFDDGSEAGLLVRFSKRPVRNEFKSFKEGVIVLEEREFVFVQKFGDSKMTVDTYAEPRHKQMFPRAYLDYKNGVTEKKGIRLEDWDAQLSEYKIAELHLLGINYVHEICQISEAQQDTLGPEGPQIIARAKIDTQDAASKENAASLQAKFDAVTRDMETLRAENQAMLDILKEKELTRSREDAEFKRHLLSSKAGEPVRRRRTKKAD